MKPSASISQKKRTPHYTSSATSCLNERQGDVQLVERQPEHHRHASSEAVHQPRAGHQSVQIVHSFFSRSPNTEENASKKTRKPITKRDNHKKNG